MHLQFLLMYSLSKLCSKSVDVIYIYIVVTIILLIVIELGTLSIGAMHIECMYCAVIVQGIN